MDARAPIQMDDDLPPPGDDFDFDTDGAFEDDPTSLIDSFGRPDVPTVRDRITAQRSDAPSTMRKGRARRHGGRPRHLQDGRRSCRKDATRRFLEALNFDADEGAEPGVEVVDTRVENAVIIDDEPEAPPPPLLADR